MTTKAISDLSNELRRIRRRLGGFDYASVEDRIAEELLSSGYICQAAPGGEREAAIKECAKVAASFFESEDSFAMRANSRAWGSAIAQRILALSALPQETPAQPQDDGVLLDWLEEQVVSEIYLDDGRLIDVRGNSVRASIRALSSAKPERAP